MNRLLLDRLRELQKEFPELAIIQEPSMCSTCEHAYTFDKNPCASCDTYGVLYKGIDSPIVTVLPYPTGDHQ